MLLRRAFLMLVSLVLGVGLVVLLIRLGQIDLRLTLHQLKTVSPMAFAKLILLNVLLVFLSTEKWLSVDAALRSPSDAVPSRGTAFVMTSAGLALGLVLPVQLGMTAARTLGTYFYGSPFKRGTAGTVLEQSFDVLIICFLAVSSGVTWFFRGKAIMWTTCAAGMSMVALRTVGPSMRLIRRFVSYLASRVGSDNRVGMALKNLSELGVLSSGVARRLVMLSTVRFGVVALMAWQTAHAINAGISLWQMSAMTPFVVVANVLAITPGGIGVNELTSVTALRLFGTSLVVAAQWSIANRILMIASCLAVAACAAVINGIRNIVVSSGRDLRRKTEAKSI